MFTKRQDFEIVGTRLLYTMDQLDLAMNQLLKISNTYDDVFFKEADELLEMKKRVKQILNKDFDKLALNRNSTTTL